MTSITTLIDLLKGPVGFGYNQLLGGPQGDFGGSGDSDSRSFLTRLLANAQNQARSGRERDLQNMERQYKQMVEQGTTGGLGIAPISAEPLSLAEQLQQQLNGIQVHTTPLDELQREANAQVSAQYDPQINQLLRDMSATKTRATNNEAESKNMYNALAQDFVNQLPDMQKQMKQQQSDIANQYASSQANLQQQYDQQKNNQQAVLEQLGIQAAAPGSMNQMNTDQAYFQQQNDLSKNQALDQINALGTADQNYTRDIANSSRLAGTNAANDIASQLEAYLQNAQGQVSDLKGAKANAIAGLVAQLQQQDAQNAQTQYNNQFNQMMALNNFQRDITSDKNQNQLDQLNMMLKQLQLQQEMGGGGLFKGTSGMSGMSNYLSQQYPNNPQEASALSSLVASVLSNPDVELGRRQTGFGTDTGITNEYLIQLLRNQAEKQGITNPMDINNAIDALLAYKGQLR
jgi:hypothetical protein